jgi:WD40 repeat protein
MLASGAEDLMVKTWDVATGEELFTLRGHDAYLCLAFSPDSRRLASAGGPVFGKGGEVRLWDTTTGSEVRTFRGPRERVSVCPAVSPGGERFALLSMNVDKWDKAELTVWDMTADRPSFATLDQYGLGVAFSPDGQFFARHSGKEVKIHQARTGREVAAFPLSSTPADGLSLQLAFRLDGQQLAAAWMASRERAGEKGKKVREAKATVQVWDVATRREVLAFEDPTAYNQEADDFDLVMGLTYSPDGQQLAAAITHVVTREENPHLHAEVQIWDATSGKPTATFRGGCSLLYGLAFAADGRRLAAVGGTMSEGMATVWDPMTGQEVLTLRGHTRPMTGVAFSPDGGRLVTASSDQTVKLWEAVTGQEVLTLRGHTRPVTSVAFSPDGRRIYSATGLALIEALLTAGGFPAELRTPAEVKVWDAAPLVPRAESEK